MVECNAIGHDRLRKDFGEQLKWNVQIPTLSCQYQFNSSISYFVE